MQCPECDHIQEQQEDLRCTRCGYQFVFDPHFTALSDYTLRAIIEQLSESGRYYFTRNQLAMAICRYRANQTSVRSALLRVTLILGIFSSLVGCMIHILVGTMLILLLICLMTYIVTYETRVSFRGALTDVQRYCKVHTLPKLVGGNAFRQRSEKEGVEFAPKRMLIDAEGNHYIPERILIVERDDLVDLLIRNQFHLQHKIAIISRSGYPEFVFFACQAFLKNDPDMPICCIHDASPQGARMVNYLRNSDKWSHLHRGIADVGLHAQIVSEEGGYLPWIQGHYLVFTRNHKKMVKNGARLALDMLPPKSLLTVIHLGIVTGSLLITGMHDTVK